MDGRLDAFFNLMGKYLGKIPLKRHAQYIKWKKSMDCTYKGDKNLWIA